MKKILRIANVLLIFTLTKVILCSSFVYSLPELTSLRPASQFNPLSKQTRENLIIGDSISRDFAAKCSILYEEGFLDAPGIRTALFTRFNTWRSTELAEFIQDALGQLYKETTRDPIKYPDSTPSLEGVVSAARPKHARFIPPPLRDNLITLVNIETDRRVKAALSRVDNASLYEKLKKAVKQETSYAQNLTEQDPETSGLLYFSYRDYFNSHEDLNISSIDVKLNKNAIFQIIRDLFYPFFKRKGFRVCDFFSGTNGYPVLISEEELKKVGYTRGGLYLWPG